LEQKERIGEAAGGGGYDLIVDSQQIDQLHNNNSSSNSNNNNFSDSHPNETKVDLSVLKDVGVRRSLKKRKHFRPIGF
jgi:hypothetical protein